MTPEQLANALRDPEALKRMQIQLMQRIVITVESRAKRIVPVLTGLLRRSITSIVEALGKRGVIGTIVDYARYVHDGTRFMEARPFFADALTDSMPEINDMLQEAGQTFFEGIVT